MSLFPSPEVHAANPPETWQVRKLCDRNWALTTQTGDRLQTGIPTRRAAEALRTEGFYFELYNDETRWYQGESVRNWKPYTSFSAANA
jgi:hypothetical protein